MPEPTDQPAKPLRTWRPMVGWTLGILAALGLAWFTATIVVPVVRVHLVVREIEQASRGARTSVPSALLDLGEPDSAAVKIRLYWRVWKPSGRMKMAALSLYCAYASRFSEVAISGLSDQSPTIRLESVTALSCAGPKTERMVAALEKAAGDSDETVRQAAAEALAKIRGEAGK